MHRTPKWLRIAAASGLSLLLFVIAGQAKADPKKVESLRKFYKESNLDFYSALIADAEDADADEKKRAKVELLADDARSKAQEQLNFLLKNADGPMRAELLIRKASLLADRSRTAAFFQNTPVKTSRLKSPQHYLKESISTFQVVEREFPMHPKMDVVLFSLGYNFGEVRDFNKSLEYYGKLITRFPESPLVGDARLAMAEMLFDKRDFGKALAHLKEVVRSENVRLKNFALYKMAWTFYNMSDIESAMNALERVIEGVNAKGTQRARLELRREALNDLVTFYAEQAENVVSGGAAAKAFDYFNRVAKTPDAIQAEYAATRAKRAASFAEKKQPLPEEERPEYVVTEPQEMLLRLTTFYRDQGKHEQAMIVADRLIDDLGRHPKAPPLYRLRAEGAEKLHKRNLVVTELERLAKTVSNDLPAIRLYKDGLPAAALPDVSAYFASIGLEQKTPPALVPSPVPVPAKADHIEPYHRILSEVAFESFQQFSGFFHAEWLKTKSPETGTLALKIYDTAVAAIFEPWKGHAAEQAYELRYRRAMLHYANSRWDEAARDYRYLALRLPHEPSAIPVKDSDKGPTERPTRDITLLAEINSLETWEKQEGIKVAERKGSVHPIHARLLEAYDNYIAFHLNDALAGEKAPASPKDPKYRETTAKILSASARLLKEYGQIDNALSRMRFFTRFFPEHKDAVPLTRDMLALLERGSRWQELKDFSSALILAGRYKGTEAEKDLDHSREYASLRLLELLEKEKRWKDAAREFTEFAREYPKSSFVSQALIKAANAALELKDTPLAIAKLEDATKAPDKAVQLQAWIGLEPYYRKAFQWARLIGVYEAILALKPDAKTHEGVQKNLKTIQALQAKAFLADRMVMAPEDKDLGALLNRQAEFDKTFAEFRKIRFAKTNRNPDQNFKRKADEHTRLSKRVDSIVKDTAKHLKGTATMWANTVKAELLLELAETLETAALPAVLLNASDADKMGYLQIISGQVQELRAKARDFVLEAAALLTEVDLPLELEARINPLLERIDEETRYQRVPFDKMWSRIPRSEYKKPEVSAAHVQVQIRKLGFTILEKAADDEEKAGPPMIELAELYYASGEPGFAYAVISPIVQAGSPYETEIRGRARRLQFEIELQRLPTELLAAIEKKTLNPRHRRDLAHWLAGYRADTDGFLPPEQDWFRGIGQTLLRPMKIDKAAPLPQK